jgi:hypothetical protein
MVANHDHQRRHDGGVDAVDDSPGPDPQALDDQLHAHVEVPAQRQGDGQQHGHDEAEARDVPAPIE